MRRLAAACALALVAGLATTGTAAPARHFLTVTGTPNSYAEVTFPVRFRLSTYAIAATPPSITTSGRYGGAYVTPVLGRGPAAGTLLLRDMGGLSKVPFDIGTREWLPAGRYRVHLLGDGATTVRLAAEGLRRNVDVRATRRSEVTGGYVSRGVAGLVYTPVDRTIVPLDLGPRTLAVIASSHESTAMAGRRNVCIRVRDDHLSPCLEANAGYGWYWSAIPFDWGLAGVAVHEPGTLPIGGIETEFFDATVGVATSFRAFAMTLEP
jgi:hypothetical protein